MNIATKSIVDSLSLDHELVLEFFIFYSRFEYSLKRAEFLKSGKKASANLDSYANSIKGQFIGVENQVFQDAVEFLKREPPQSQIVAENKLNWEKTVQSAGEHDERYVLRVVAIVRNNLFHGGKFPVPVGSMEDVSRNQRLLQACVTVLIQCLTLSPYVRCFFEYEVSPVAEMN